MKKITSNWIMYQCLPLFCDYFKKVLQPKPLEMNISTYHCLQSNLCQSGFINILKYEYFVGSNKEVNDLKLERQRGKWIWKDQIIRSDIQQRRNSKGKNYLKIVSGEEFFKC